ncbi:MAG TPA: arginine--tRNA ligase, partial [Bdellovibrionota bacterium]|nr:arginine--tRNA ligase [Bdellovibrionota bacterium]
MERFAKHAAQALSLALKTEVPATELELPPDPKMGDFGFPCFRLAKEYKKGPPQVAQQIAGEIQSTGKLPKEITVAAVGPYVNFTVAPEAVLSALLSDILAGEGLGRYGSLPSDSRGSWVLEYSSPNVAKPLNIYHLRPTALGAALDRIGRYRGYRVISINHLGDWGKQYGMLVVAFRVFGKTLESKLTMMELVDLYVKVNAEVEKHPELGEEAKQAFVKLEKGDPAVRALWKKCVDISLEEFDRAYKRLGVKFDHIWGESFYEPQLQPMIEDMRKKGLLIESEGAWVVPVTDEKGRELPPCIVQKTDGATIYATRDLAAAIYRHGQFKFDRMTYIVGSEQRLHFQQVFATLRKMGHEWVSRCEHVGTGLYRFKDAKMSTRKGNFVTLEEVLELTKTRVRELMTERYEKAQADAEEGSIGQPPTDEICEAVAVGATVFHDLHTDPVKDVEFDVERVVDFQGETGPYLQYAHTRCVSILRKAGAPAKFDAKLVARLGAPEELALVKVLGQFPLHL